MSRIYFLKAGLKLLPDQGLILINRQLKSLPKKRLEILSELKSRPLFARDLKDFSSQSWSQYLSSVTLKVNPQDLKQRLLTDFEPCSQARAEAWKVEAKTSIILSWGEATLKLAAGSYLLEFYFPQKITGKCQITYFKKQNLYLKRDEWILKQLKETHPSFILELGCGEKPRLAYKIQEQFPAASYLGVDKQVEESQCFKKLNFLKTLPEIKLPHVVVAEEVIEHISEKSVLTLLHKLHSQGATRIILTTPNHDYNVNLNTHTRHKEHHFEWGEKELKAWIKQLKSEFKVKVKIAKIGKSIRGVAPTWGIIISF